MILQKIPEQYFGTFIIWMIISFAVGWIGCWVKWVMAEKEDDKFFNRK